LPAPAGMVPGWAVTQPFITAELWQAEFVLTKHSPHKTAETLLR